MSPEGCSSLTLRCPEGKDHCWRAYGKSGRTTFWVYWSLCSRKDAGTPSLRLSRKGQDGDWDLKIVERRKEIIKVDLRPFQSTYPDGLDHQGNSKSRDHRIWIQTNSKAATFLSVTVEVVRSQTLKGLTALRPASYLFTATRRADRAPRERSSATSVYMGLYSSGLPLKGHCGDPCFSSLSLQRKVTTERWMPLELS